MEALDLTLGTTKAYGEQFMVGLTNNYGLYIGHHRMYFSYCSSRHAILHTGIPRISKHPLRNFFRAGVVDTSVGQVMMYIRLLQLLFQYQLVIY